MAFSYGNHRPIVPLPINVAALERATSHKYPGYIFSLICNWYLNDFMQAIKGHKALLTVNKTLAQFDAIHDLRLHA